MKSQTHYKLDRLVRGLLIIVFSYVALQLIGGYRVEAACPVLPTDNGTATSNISVPVDGTYNIWVRMMSPDSLADSVYVEIEDSSCGNAAGGTGLTADTWTWVDYKDGNTGTKMSTSLTAGTHTLKMTGDEAGVKVDRVLLLTDACVPTGTGDNCSGTPDSTPPTVSLTQPANGANVSGIVTVTANASDDQTLSAVDFYIDGNQVGTDTTAPYEYSWDTTLETEGSHSLYSIARDEWNNTATSSSIFVTVANTATGSASVNLLPPTGTYTNGENVVVTVEIDSGTDNINAAQVRIDYDPAEVSYVSTDVSTSDFDTAAPSDSGSNYITVARGHSATLSGNSEFAKVTFQVAASSGQIFLTLGETETQVLNAGVDLALTLSGSVYGIDDVTPPTAPTNLSAIAVGSSQVNLTWSAASDNVAVDDYEVLRDGVVVGANLTTTSYFDSTVSAGNTYTYTVRAYDTSGNVSGASNSAVITVQTKPGDFNNDGFVNIQDLSILLGNWGTSDSQTDLNGDNTINIVDLSIFLSYWGT